jgi:hypothetical protein
MRDLHSIIPKEHCGRPFTCDGLLQSCTVMVVGENPGTPTETDWWTWWNNETGFFDLRQFEGDYGPTLTRTRECFNRLRKCHRLRCLETNIYAQEKRDGHVRGDKPQRELLQAFVSELPGLTDIVTHGRVAEREMKRIISPRLRRWPPMPHFSGARRLSRDAVNELIDDLAAKIKAARGLSRDEVNELMNDLAAKIKAAQRARRDEG